MSSVRLSVATADYDHVRDLVSGAVPVDGADPVWMVLPVEEIFHRFFVHGEFDVAEVSMARYAQYRADGGDAFVALPVFTSRVFRHRAFVVRDDSPLTALEDLAGKRVGVPEWVQTAGVYARAVLEHHGVGLDEIAWTQAGLRQPGRREHVPPRLPSGVAITSVTDRSLTGMLAAGELDALITAREPGGPFRPLLADARDRERAYYDATGIYPIMHTVAVRRRLLEEHSWLATALFKAFCRARDASLERLTDTAVSRIPVPWLPQTAGDPSLPGFGWPYGVAANHTTLDAFLRHCHDQGVCAARLTPEDAFLTAVEDVYRV
ncbi:PhnD/SsuA/transferrin family substrate-binding protein [Actinomadura rayongensis]|uniref:PhnD/SsuA/transferrin family substrate-binding protein n=1 Tax=Actinomadura rayongensis TaxID=1429076 RepID=A0A6I4WCJ7_9ACTN|nr:PhnD/SsuA/transferrin family substrate-binding protein [Actinomadura rayongensis]MXQ67408.1 PhnD/SsuA/transferrin family substrate-binding protein [Actinomadura rayongensis]